MCKKTMYLTSFVLIFTLVELVPARENLIIDGSFEINTDGTPGNGINSELGASWHAGSAGGNVDVTTHWDKASTATSARSWYYRRRHRRIPGWGLCLAVGWEGRYRGYELGVPRRYYSVCRPGIPVFDRFLGRDRRKPASLGPARQRPDRHRAPRWCDHRYKRRSV